jgi:hypothetical protein
VVTVAIALACDSPAIVEPPLHHDIQVPLALVASDRLPDLGMARLSDISVQSNGRRLLRFSTTIVNVGAGAFELHGQRATTLESQMAVAQRIFDDAGGWRDVPTSAVMVYSGDGHDHWHVQDLQFMELFSLDDGSRWGTSAKRGFCFWDNVEYKLWLPGAPQSDVYTESGCGEPQSLQVAMGLSVGWGDIYPYWLPDQNIDISGIRNGRYRLVVTADPAGWFAEANESNNVTWVDLDISRHGRSVRVIAYGPSA